VDFPTFGSPTIPAFSMEGNLARRRKRKNCSQNKPQFAPFTSETGIQIARPNGQNRPANSNSQFNKGSPSFQQIEEY